LPSSSPLSNSITTDSAAAPSAGAASAITASATTAFTAAAYTASLMALVYIATQAFKASFSDINYIGSPSTAPTSKLSNIPLLRGLYQ